MLKKIIWRLLGLAVLVVLGVVLVNAVQQSFSQAVQPVRDAAEGVATQVAQALNPTPTVLPDPVTIIHEVRSLARLETIQYSVEKVITAETRQGAFKFFVGDRLILVAHGVVVAGVDLAQLRPEHLVVKNQVLYVTLPPAEIFITALDNQQSYVYDRETGVFTHGEVDLETTARRAAELEIEESALEDGILELARQNAEVFLSRLLRDLGYPEVIFEE